MARSYTYYWHAKIEATFRMLTIFFMCGTKVMQTFMQTKANDEIEKCKRCQWESQTHNIFDNVHMKSSYFFVGIIIIGWVVCVCVFIIERFSIVLLGLIFSALVFSKYCCWCCCFYGSGPSFIVYLYTVFCFVRCVFFPILTRISNVNSNGWCSF